MSDRRRALFVCHDAGGTIPPVLAVAEAMVAEGHEVTVLSQPSVRARAERVGARFAAFSSLPDYERTRTLEEQLDRTIPALVGPEVGDDLLTTAAAADADVLVVDPNLTGALAAAESTDLRSTVLLHCLHRTFVDLWFAQLWPLLDVPINETRRHFGLDGSGSWASLFDAHDAVVAPVPAVFDGTAHAGGQQHHGFLVPEPRAGVPETFVAGDDDDRPTVLVGLSTTYQRHEPLLAAIVQALGTLPVRALVTTGGHVGVDAAAPPNVAVTDHADHAALMSTVDLVVTHAGLGTLAVALSNGVPVVCAPIDRDQPLNAERVAAVGAGIVLEERTPTAIAGAIERVLGDEDYRAASRAIAEASAVEGGAPSAARAILEL